MAKFSDIIETADGELEVVSSEEIITKPIVYQDNYKIVQANELIRSKQDSLSTMETMLIKLVEAQITKGDEEFSTYVCNATDIANYLNMDRTNLYREMKEIASTLSTKHIFIETPGKTQKKNFKIMPWLQSFSYEDGNVTIRLNDELKPFLLGLNGKFASVMLEQAKKIRSPRAVRLYEILKSYENMCFGYDKNIGNTTGVELKPTEQLFTIDTIKTEMGLEDKYANNADFMKSVIAPAVKAIADAKAMMLTYRTIKSGRKYQYIIFNLHDQDAFPNWYADKISSAFIVDEAKPAAAPKKEEKKYPIKAAKKDYATIRRAMNKVSKEAGEALDPVIRKALEAQRLRLAQDRIEHPECYDKDGHYIVDDDDV